MPFRGPRLWRTVFCISAHGRASRPPVGVSAGGWCNRSLTRVFLGGPSLSVLLCSFWQFDTRRIAWELCIRPCRDPHDLASGNCYKQACVCENTTHGGAPRRLGRRRRGATPRRPRRPPRLRRLRRRGVRGAVLNRSGRGWSVCCCLFATVVGRPASSCLNRPWVSLL